MASTAGIESAARLYAEWGETTEALAIARKLPDPYSQERLLYRILADGLAAGHAEAAPGILGFLWQPAWRARAQGLTAAARVHGAMESARKSAEAIGNPAEKSALLSELARLAAHGGDNGNATQLFERAGTLAEVSTDAASRDAALAILARNRALAESF